RLFLNSSKFISFSSCGLNNGCTRFRARKKSNRPLLENCSYVKTHIQFMEDAFIHRLHIFSLVLGRKSCIFKGFLVFVTWREIINISQEQTKNHNQNENSILNGCILGVVGVPMVTTPSVFIY
ncbi:MAG: hypothetical protein IKY23_07835, partial [Lachnospiraceae bacterium]|nr:hypothetical protein [Lachnospiraceae bacterium]